MTADSRPSVRLIGLMLQDPTTVLEAAGEIGFNPEWFDGGWSRTVYREIERMARQDEPVDVAFVARRLKDKGVKAAQLRGAIASAPTQKRGVDKLLEQVREEHVTREVRRLAGELADAPAAMEAAQSVAQQLLELTAPKQDDEDHVAAIEAQWERAFAGEPTGLPMPWEKLYREVGGPEPGQVSLFVAPGGTGKSRAMNQWARHASMSGWPSLVFSFEDGIKGAMQRQVGMAVGVDPFRLRTGKASRDDIDRAKIALRCIEDLHFVEQACRVEQMFSIAQHHVVKRGVRAVFVDAFLDIAGEKDTAGMDHTMDGLVHIARRLHVPLVVAHHVRKTQPSQNVKDLRQWLITRNDLRGSGRLWDCAKGMVLILQAVPRPGAEPTLDGEAKMDYCIEVSKSNFGPAGMRKAVAPEPCTQEWKEIAPPTFA